MNRHFLPLSLAAALTMSLLSAACTTAPAKPDEAMADIAHSGSAAENAPKADAENGGEKTPQADASADGDSQPPKNASEEENSQQTAAAAPDASETPAQETSGEQAPAASETEQPAETPEDNGPKPLPPEVVSAFDEAMTLAAAPSGEGVREALDKLAPLATDDPRTAAIHYNLGLLRERSGDLTAAEKHYADCLGLNADHRSAAMNLARLFIRQRRADVGIRFF